MILSDLHKIENFTSLFEDPRFIALTLYLRKNRPRQAGGESHQMLFQTGKAEGWLDCVDAMVDARIPKVEVSTPDRPRYSQPATLGSPSENQPR